MRMKKPYIATLDQVKISREDEYGIIEYTEPNVSSVRLKIGPEVPEMSDEEAAQAQEFMKKMMASVEVTATDETKKISDYNCKKYIVSFMMMKSEYWVSKDVKAYKEFRVLSEKMAKMFENNPMLKQMNIMGIMENIDGFPVQTVVEMMGGSITSTLIKAEKKDVSKDVFEVPKDYTLTEAKETQTKPM